MTTAILQVETGLQQLMGDRALYLQILHRFRQRYHDVADRARAALAAGDAAEAQRIAHTLKGAAGMIGAQQVYVLAAALESACTAPALPANGRAAPLAQLEQALRNLLPMVENVLAAADLPPAPAAAADPHPPSTTMLVQHLARLLEDGDGAAIDLLEQSATVLAAGLGVAVFQEVTAAAHQFEFEAALAALRGGSA
jgi:two-component system sensor histidine kinase/response regulator